LSDYADYVETFARHHDKFSVLVFVFEGNDFEIEKDKRLSTPSHLLKTYVGIFSNTNVYRVTKSLIKRALHRSEIRGETYVTLRDVRGQHIALLTRYIEATRAKELTKNELFERALTRLKKYPLHIFFIPTNYRIYYRVLEGAQAPALPDANWTYLKSLCVREEIRCTNLTPAMVHASDALLAKNELLWWPDDTHWNRNGIAVAARVVAETLKRGDPALGGVQGK
jgi:ribosomal protein L10